MNGGPMPERGKDSWEAGREEDARLIKGCLLGNESAWSELVSKYKNLIFSIPIKYGLSRDDAADIFQAVCLDLLNDLSKIRDHNALAAWIIRVTYNKCFHRKKDSDRYVPDELPEMASPAEDVPESMLLEVQREQLLRNAMRQLSSRCQQLIQMLFFEFPARPYQEVAKSLNLATGSIGFIRGRCLQKMRQLLEKLGLA
jgi:RNA polymerase sigma factor (sigma-70 family)